MAAAGAASAPLPSAELLLLSLVQVPAAALHSLVVAEQNSAETAVYTTLAALLANACHPDYAHLRPLLHAVVHRLAQQPKHALPLPLLALYAHAFLPANSSLVTEQVIPDAIAATPKLAQELGSVVPAALEQALAQGSETALDADILLSLIRATARAALTAPVISRVVDLLAEAYPPATDRLRLSVLETAHDLVRVSCEQRQGLALSGTSASHSPIVEALQPLLASLLAAAGENSALARDLLAFYPTLVADDLPRAVQGAVGPTARTVKDQIARWKRLDTKELADQSWLERLREEEQGKRGAALGGAADAQVGIAREKEEGVTKAGPAGGPAASGKNDSQAAADKEADLAAAVASLLDLFPSESPAFLRACLVHPRFAGEGHDSQAATERTVEALLSEVPLPDELTRIRLGEPASSRPAAAPGQGQAAPAVSDDAPAAAAASTERRNVYDDDKYFKRGTLLAPASARRRNERASEGGGASGAASRSGGGGGKVQLDERLKASIIALAERESSDEEDEEGTGGYGFGFEEEDAVEVGAGARTPRGRAEAGPGGGAGDEEPDENEVAAGASPAVSRPASSMGLAPSAAGARTPSSSPYDPATVLALEKAYLSTPSVFARDSATRRGKARRELRDRTGLGDEQVEGWKIMLERDPKRVQKLQDKHTDLGARSNKPQQGAAAPPGGTAGGGAGRGGRGGARGGRGGARGGGATGGGGGGGGGGSGQGGAPPQQQQKRSDGGRKEHDRAKRGRDRKMARMGAVAPPG